MSLSLASLFTLCFLESAGRPAATIAVPDDRLTIQEAIDAAPDGGAVLVNPGVYRGPGNCEIELRGKSIVLESRAGAARTTIDCEGRSRGFIFAGGDTALVRGFTVIHGRGLLSGGLSCLPGSSPRIEECVIARNFGDPGGGVYCGPGSRPSFESCSLAENVADTSGGGVYCDQDSSPLFRNCTIAANFAWRRGGGVFARRSAAEFLECTIAGNFSRSGGGGFYIGEGSTPRLFNCVVAGNRARSVAGGVYIRDSRLWLLNCTVTENDSLRGGDVHCSGAAEPWIVQCIIWGNSREAACPLEPSNCNLSAEDPRFRAEGAYRFGRFRDIAVGGGDLDLEVPDFVITPGDYRLRATSPAIDRAFLDSPGIDRNGVERPCGGEVDIGAYEYCEDVRFRPGDSDGDGAITLTDAVYIANWLFRGGAEPACLAACDTAEDGWVNLADVVAVLNFLFQGGSRGVSWRCEAVAEGGLSCGVTSAACE